MLHFVFLLLLTFVYGETVGYWWWTWSGAGNPPGDTNMGIAFSGWVDPYQAISDSAGIKVSTKLQKRLLIRRRADFLDGSSSLWEEETAMELGLLVPSTRSSVPFKTVSYFLVST
jgi:hypothetical protein